MTRIKQCSDKKEQLEGLLSAGSDVPASTVSICWCSSAWRPQRYLRLSLWFYLVDLDWKGGGPTFRSFGHVLALRSWVSSAGPFVQKLLAAAVEVGLLLGYCWCGPVVGWLVHHVAAVLAPLFMFRFAAEAGSGLKTRGDFHWLLLLNASLPAVVFKCSSR